MPRAAQILVRGILVAGWAWTVAICGSVSAAPLAYPTTATPFVSPPSPASSANGKDGISAGLAQPSFLASGASPAGSDGSVSVPGLSQPQFLITDHPAIESHATDWRAKRDDSSQDRDATSDPQSGWSLLWRQATGGASGKASNKSAAGVAAAPDRNAQNRIAAPAVQIQPGNASVWTELAPPKPRSNAEQAQSQQPQRQESFDSLVNQLGMQKQTDPSNALVESPSSTVSRESSRSRVARTQPPRAVNAPTNAPQENSEYSGLWSQIAGDSGSDQSQDTNGAMDDPRHSTQPGNISSQRANRVQPAAAWSATDQRPQVTQAQPTSFWSGLARPFTMQTDEAPIRRPAASQTAGVSATSEQSGEDSDESEHVPKLLMPFYQTNISPQAGRSETPLAQARSRHHGPNIENTVRGSQLTRQLAMTDGEDLHYKPGDDAALRSDQEAWDSGWTRQSPSGLNPFAMTFNPDQPVKYASQTMTVAYLQETIPPPGDAPEPDKINLPGDENAEQADNGENAAGDNQHGEGDEGKKKEDKLATADKLGKKPEDRSLDFLRTETVLLKPGKYAFDIGMQYLIQERNFPILFRTIDPTNPVDDAHVLTTDGQTIGLNVDEARFKSRELEMPLQLRYGLFKRVQAFIGAPVGWSNTEVDLTGRDEFKNDGGLGDISFGTTIQFQDGQADCPYVIGTFVATAPSGGDPFTNAALFSPSAPSLGNGFWKLGGNLLFIQPLDPVTFFYGAGIRGSFAHDYIGATFEPGMEYNYTFGLGFAINEKVTLSSQLFGEYQSRLQVNGQGLDGTSQEPISLQLAATIARPCDRLVEPFVQFGLTEDAVAVNIGITWTY
jgi:Putative MetA-pathway of phenol degradation